MTRNRLLDVSERWFRLLQRLYPPDFRDEMGNALVEAYMRSRARRAANDGGRIRLVALWFRALCRLAAQRPGRAGAPGGIVAARRQLGPRCRAASHAGWCARRCSPPRRSAR